MNTTFNNITITIRAKTTKDAYNKLKVIMQHKDIIFFTSDIYTIGDKPNIHDTETLF